MFRIFNVVESFNILVNHTHQIFYEEFKSENKLVICWDSSLEFKIEDV